jgi:uncharacterized OsmC-like protein
MKITLLSEEAIRLEPIPGPMTIEASSADQQYSPFHMLASSLAFCTYSVLASWASNAKLESGDIVVEVTWTFAEDPHRVGDMNMKIVWPSLPPARHAAANRVSALCAVHATLTHPPSVNTTVEGSTAPALAAAGTAP